MQIIVKNMKIINFKRIKEKEISFKENVTNIFGCNGCGKTTIADAFMWVFFDKDIDGKKAQPKPVDINNNEIHMLTTSVEIVIEVDGIEKSFKKVLEESWVKKRGELEKTYKGNEITYYVDTVPLKQSEYVNVIASMIDEKKFLLLTNPLYFNSNLDSKERREILLHLTKENIDDNEILQDEKYAELLKEMNTHTADEYTKILDVAIKQTNKDIDDIPARIDENMKMIPDELDAAECENKLSELQKLLEEKNTKINDLKNDGKSIETRNKIAQLENEILDYDKKIKEIENSALDELNKHKEMVNNSKYTINKFTKEMQEIDDDIKKYENKIADIKVQYRELKAKAYNDDEIVCPYTKKNCDCLSDFKEDKKKNFEESKEKEINILKEDGFKIKSQMDEKVKTKEMLSLQLQTQQEHLKGLEENEVNFMDSEDCKTYKKNISINKDEIERLKAEIEVGSKSSTLELLLADKRNYELQIAGLQEKIAKIKSAESIQMRVDELKKEHKFKIALNDKQQRLKWLLEEFTREKSRKLESSINNIFKATRFKLFENQINGGINETCKAIDERGVEFIRTNTASRLNMGVDCINALCEFYNVQAPIFCDNRESVTNIVGTKSQIINLIVSPSDTELRVE